MAKIINVSLMIAFGIVLAVGGILWTIQAGNMVGPVTITVEEDCNLSVGHIPNNMATDLNIFPAIMGITSGITWCVCAFMLNFPGSIFLAFGAMLIPIGILNFLRGVFLVKPSLMV